jgi:hypothetical protein
LIKEDIKSLTIEAFETEKVELVKWKEKKWTS